MGRVRPKVRVRAILVVHYFHEYFVSRKVICEWEF